MANGNDDGAATPDAGAPGQGLGQAPSGGARGGINLQGLRSPGGGRVPQKSEKGTPTGVGPRRPLDSDRRMIAFILLAILAGVILVEVFGSGVLAVSCWFSEKDGACPRGQAALGLLTNALGAVFTAMVGLVGSVVGFYFGSQKQS